MAMPIPISGSNIPPANNAGTKSITIKSSGTKPAIDSTQHTGVKSVEEQQAETEANETKKEKAEVENKPSEQTTTQSQQANKQITAANISSALSSAKPDDKAATPNKPNSVWEQLKNSRFPKDSTSTGTQGPDPLSSGTNGQSRIGQAFSDPKELQNSFRNDNETIANKYDGLSTVEQAGLDSSSQQQSQGGPSGQTMGGGPGGPNGYGSGPTTIIANNGNVVGNSFGDTSAIGTGSLVEGATPTAPELLTGEESLGKNSSDKY